MPTLSRYTNRDLPDHFAHQIRDFIRIHWFDAFQYDVRAPAVSDDLSPVYFVLAEDPPQSGLHAQERKSLALLGALREIERSDQTSDLVLRMLVKNAMPKAPDSSAEFGPRVASRTRSTSRKIGSAVVPRPRFA